MFALHVRNSPHMQLQPMIYLLMSNDTSKVTLVFDHGLSNVPGRVWPQYRTKAVEKGFMRINTFRA